MKRQNKTKDLAFLGNEVYRLVLIIVFFVIINITHKIAEYGYLVSQKEVAANNIEFWHCFLSLAGITTVMSIICKLIIIFSQMWIIKVQKMNFFQEYNSIIQLSDKTQKCMKLFEYANCKITAIVEIISAIINVFFTLIAISSFEDVTFTYGIGGIIIFSIGCGFGVLRGILQQKANMLRAEIDTSQKTLTNNYMISFSVLKERLKDIDNNYWKQIIFQVSKNLVASIPDVIKILVFFMLVWSITENFNFEGTVYSHTNLISLLYTYILSAANDFGNIVEDITKIIKFKKDEEVREILAYKEENDELLLKQSSNIVMNNSGFTIFSNFKAFLIKKNGEKAYYIIPKELRIRKGELVMLDGENGVGKSRLIAIIKGIIRGVFTYNSETVIINEFLKNFKIKDSNIDYSLIIRLSSELNMDRIPETEEGLKKMVFDTAPNGADNQLLVLLQILYFLNIDTENEKPKLIILDEILANIEENIVSMLMKVLKNEMNSLGVCGIIVTHAHKELVYPYVEQIWHMDNEGDKTFIRQVPK